MKKNASFPSVEKFEMLAQFSENMKNLICCWASDCEEQIQLSWIFDIGLVHTFIAETEYLRWNFLEKSNWDSSDLKK